MRQLSNGVKRFAKILLIVVLSFAAIVAALTLYLKIKYPAERLKAILISYLADSYGIQATIGSLRLNLFSGFELDDLALLPADRNVRAPVAIDRVTFAYRWRSLLARKLDIDKITFDHPVIVYRQASDSTSNLDAFLEALSDTATVAADTTASNLPVTIHLEDLAFQDLEIDFELASTIDTLRALAGPLDIEVTQIDIDREANFSSMLQISADAARLIYAMLPIAEGTRLEIDSELNADVSGAMSLDSLHADFSLSLDSNRLTWDEFERVPIKRLSAQGEIWWHPTSSRYLIPDFQLTVDDKDKLAAHFEMELGDSTYAYRFGVQHGSIDLAQITNLLNNHGGDSLQQALEGWSPSGSLIFSGTELDGDQSGLKYRVELSSDEIDLENQITGFRFSDGRLQLGYGSTSDSLNDVSCNLSFGGFELPMDTTSILECGNGSLKLDMQLDQAYSPIRGDFEFVLNQFSQGLLSGHGSLKPASDPRDQFNLDSEMKADSIELLPLTASVVSGRASGSIKLTGARFDNLELRGEMRNAPLIYKMEEYEGEIPAYRWTANGRLQLNSEFTEVKLENGELKCDPGTIQFRAKYEVPNESFDFDVMNADLELAQIMRVLPTSTFAGTVPPKVFGKSRASGWINGKFLPPDSLDYTGAFTIRTDSASYHDSELGLYANTLLSESEWRLTTTALSGQFSASCFSPEMPDYLRKPLPTTTMSGTIAVDESSFTIKDGKGQIPKWRLTSNYNVAGKFKPHGLQVKTDVDLKFSSVSPIEMQPGVLLWGDVRGNLVVDQFLPDSSDQPQPMRISGWLKTDGMHVTVDTLFAVHGMNADCHFDQEMDLLDLSLKPSENTQSLAFASQGARAGQNYRLANAGEALLLHDIFRDAGMNGRRPSSRISIERVIVLGFPINNVLAELEIGNCRFDIPQLQMDLFGGNMIGNLLVGLGDGAPENIDYATSMQISSIDVWQFRRLGSEVQKGSLLSADFHLSGRGAAPEMMDDLIANLAGRLNITKIEQKVASNLLQALDPNGTDAGIQRMRLLLKTGWNVKHMTFEIKNGFVYASLAPIKLRPWSALFNLPPTLDFARLPMRYFMETSEE